MNLETAPFSGDIALHKSNPWNVPYNQDRTCNYELCCSANEMSDAVQCSFCMLDVYCSAECQRLAREKHDKSCVPFSDQPTPKSVLQNRPNVLKYHLRTSRPEHIFHQCFFTRLKNEHRFRQTHYGTARFQKTLIICASDEDCFDFYERLQSDHSLMRAATIGNSANSVQRDDLLGRWKMPDCRNRVLFSSRIEDDEFVVPDLENLVIFEREHPSMDRTNNRIYRMARMCGQQGMYISIAPSLILLTQQHLNTVSRDPAEWRPKSWADTARHFKIWKDTEGLHDRPSFTLDYICESIGKGEYYFDEDEVLIERSNEKGKALGA